MTPPPVDAGGRDVLDSGRAGRPLVRRPRTLAVSAVVVLAAAAVGGYEVGSRGGAPPRPAATGTAAASTGPRAGIDAALVGLAQDRAHRRVAVTVSVFNEGDQPVVVRAAGVSRPGLRLTGARFVVDPASRGRHAATPPLPLYPGDVARVTVSYRVGDCARARRTSFRLPLAVTLGSGQRDTVDITADLAVARWRAGLLSAICPGPS